MYDIITVGSATVDVFAATTSQLVKFLTAQGEQDFIAYPSGSKILISQLDFLVGGGGTNTAVSFSRLGLKTGFVGKLGVDENAYKVLHVLEQEGVAFLGSKEGQTGYSIILDSIEHDRTILTYKGSNNTLRYQELPREHLHATWGYFSSMMDTSFRASLAIAKQLKSQGSRIAFNPSSYQARQGYAALQELLSITDALILNKEEAQLLLGKQASIEELATLLGHKGITYVAVTDGKAGVVCYHQECIYHLTPTPHLVVRESTGAGDAFASGFVAALCQQKPLREALTQGMVQAESVIQYVGAKEKLLTKEEADHAVLQFQGTFQSFPAPQGINASDLLEGLKGKGPVVADQPFLFSTGKEISSLEELAYYLKFISLQTFEQHLHETGNDFALWIRHSFNLPDLANQIAMLDNQYAMSALLLDYIHHGGTKQ